MKMLLLLICMSIISDLYAEEIIKEAELLNLAQLSGKIYEEKRDEIVKSKKVLKKKYKTSISNAIKAIIIAHRTCPNLNKELKELLIKVEKSKKNKRFYSHPWLYHKSLKSFIWKPVPMIRTCPADTPIENYKADQPLYLPIKKLTKQEEKKKKRRASFAKIYVLEYAWKYAIYGSQLIYFFDQPSSGYKIVGTRLEPKKTSLNYSDAMCLYRICLSRIALNYDIIINAERYYKQRYSDVYSCEDFINKLKRNRINNDKIYLQIINKLKKPRLKNIFLQELKHLQTQNSLISNSDIEMLQKSDNFQLKNNLSMINNLIKRKKINNSRMKDEINL